MTSNIPTYALAFSPGGALLARGGEAGLDIYDSFTLKKITGVPHAVPPGVYGPVVALKWASMEGQFDMLFVGTKHGYVFAWQKNDDVYVECHVFRVPEGGEILSMAIHSNANRFRLAVGTIMSVLACYDILPDRLWNEWYETLVDVEPRSIDFATSGKNIVVFSTFSGQMHIFSKKERTLDQGRNLASLIGYATMSKDGKVLIDNTANFGLHDGQTGTLLAMFSSGNNISAVPKHVLFGEDEEIVVTGSDTGNAYVFRKTGGGPEQVLINASDGFTQIVATSSTASTNYIACATSSLTNVGAISLWTCKREVGEAATSRDSTASRVNMPERFWQLLQRIWQFSKDSNACLSKLTSHALVWTINFAWHGLLWMAKVCVLLSLLLSVAYLIWSTVEDDVPGMKDAMRQGHGLDEYGSLEVGAYADLAAALVHCAGILNSKVECVLDERARSNGDGGKAISK
ncbi:hypothetical protein PUNSTDRAFT_139577 [Punctularia strigosozonata HHB-11173 SS5]|uniref:WD40 repeat-like protein n=1 Tax=Punctularia strigosozonata (strain HHB-11173) TaxID=741275 RepID=R7S2D1_PUNST|nr:uncharacterized protein PUNSTDRAFT_139577 [Punctularia strigosozonata HHB-11173 SS5]EIN03406.1 hypothetical protein PUNSTDRAFT_139577 [Punctularia strigosozonata HHB-11173 SS5]